MRRALTLLAAVVLFAAPLGARLPAPPDPRALLRDIAQFTDAEWAAVERGEAVAKVLESDAREVAIAGAVRITGSRATLLQRYRDISLLKTSALVLDVNRFSPSPSAADLERAPFEDRSLDLRDCKPGDCAVRLSGADIARFHREVDWRAADWRTQSAAVWREVLAEHARAYRASGRRALPQYVNRAEPLSVAAELSLLVADYGFLATYAPELHRYLGDLTSPGPPGTEHQLYWSKEDFGVRPILRISHQIIVHGTADLPVSVVATNQVYADHYLDAALSVTLAIEAGRDFYMVTMNRARTRSLSGMLRRIVRSIVQTRSRDTMRRILVTTKTAIEQRPG